MRKSGDFIFSAVGLYFLNNLVLLFNFPSELFFPTHSLFLHYFNGYIFALMCQWEWKILWSQGLMKCQLEQRDKVSLERLQRDAGRASSRTMVPRPEDRDSLASWPGLALTRCEGMVTHVTEQLGVPDGRCAHRLPPYILQQIVFSWNEGPKCDSCWKKHKLALLKSLGFPNAARHLPLHNSFWYNFISPFKGELP